MNERFVAIKVDREERPDLDQIYMAAVQTIRTGRLADDGVPDAGRASRFSPAPTSLRKIAMACPPSRRC